MASVAVVTFPGHVPEHSGRTARGVEQTRQHLERRGFARSIWAEKTDQFPFPDGKAHVFYSQGQFMLAVEQSLDGAHQARFLFISAE